MSALTPHEIVLRPLITEKTLRMAERDNAYTFQIRTNANKVQVRDAVERIFKVGVVAIRTQNCLGKFRRVGRYTGATSNWKKAIVTVKQGDSIEFY